MVSSEIPGRPASKGLVRWLAGASTLIYLCSRFVPYRPPIRYGEIEDSYIQFLHTAFAEHLHFGREVVFTFGPWGFLYGGYHPATHLVSVIVWVGLSMVLWWTAWKVARHFSQNELVAWLWLMALAMVAGLPVFYMIDVRLKAFIILLWVLHFFVEDQRLTLAQIALAVALGLLSLIKINLFVETLLVLALISLDTVARQKRFPWLLVCYGGSLLLFWILARQSLSTVAPYLRGVGYFTRGYTEAAMLTGPRTAQDVGCFLVTAALVCATAGYVGWLRHRLFVPLSLITLGVILFTTFKHGYVRHDSHDAVATLELFLLSLASLAITWPVARTIGRRAALASLLPTILISVFAVSTFDRYHQDGLPSHLLRTLSIRSVFGPAKLLFGTGYLRRGYETYLGDIRRDTPLPAMDGTVDTYPGNAGAILAYGLPYRPRPVMQSLAVDTPELADLNAAFVRGERASDSILFQIAPVDDHFPSLEDGRSWPELLACYDVRQVEWPFALLKRSPVPRAWRLTPLVDTAIRFGEVVPVPPSTNGPIWATIDIDRTLWGRIASTLYKPPILSLTIVTPDGRPATYRLVPGMARSGFLLSPVIQNPVDFGLLAADCSPDLADKEATSLVLSGEIDSGLACYRLPMRLRLYRLEYPRQDLSKLAGLPELKSLARTNKRSQWLRADYRAELVYRPQCGSVLQVAPDSAMQIPVPEQSKRLRIGFGILARTGGDLPQTGGVRFRVSGVGPQGELIPMWSHQLDSRGGETTLEPHRAEIDITRIPSTELVLETVRAGPKENDQLAAYWSEIQIE